MKLQKILRSHLGFSMVEVTVAMGLLGIATLAVVNLSENVNTSTRRAEMLLSKSQFASALGNYINSSPACDEFIDMGSFSATETPITLSNWKVAGLEGDPELPMQGGRKFKNFELKSLTATVDTTSTGLQKIKIDNSDHIKTFLNVKAVLEIKTGQRRDDGQDKREFQYIYNIPIIATSSGEVHSCSEEKLLRETCESMKGTYVKATNECKLKETCEIQGSFQQLSCYPTAGQTCKPTYGGTLPNPVTGSATCPPGTSPVQTGYRGWTHEGVCSGKKCDPPTVQDHLKYYSCMKCPPSSGSTNTTTTTGGSYNGGGGSNNGCFVAGTQILLFGGELKNIEDVTPEDKVVNHRGQEISVLSLKSYHYRGKVYSINGGGYFFTPNHPFLTVKGWRSLDPEKSMQESPDIKVEMLEIGDVLIKKKGFEVITTLDAKDVDEMVYNFEVSGDHQYIAEDYVVHNIEQNVKNDFEE